MYTYEYFPKDKIEARGEFCFDYDNKKLIYHNRSKTHGRSYYLHVTRELIDETGNFKEKGIVAWY